VAGSPYGDWCGLEVTTILTQGDNQPRPKDPKLEKEGQMRILTCWVGIILLSVFILGCTTKERGPLLENTNSSSKVTVNDEKTKPTNARATIFT